MQLEYNARVTQLPVNANTIELQHARVLITPPIDEDYWMMRVPLTDKQAIVCFPKFGTVGIGFQVEEDWNTNLPYTCETAEIYDHIKHNKSDRRITRAKAIAAIELLQTEIRRVRQD